MAGECGDRKERQGPGEERLLPADGDSILAACARLHLLLQRVNFPGHCRVLLLYQLKGGKKPGRLSRSFAPARILACHRAFLRAVDQGPVPKRLYPVGGGTFPPGF